MTFTSKEMPLGRKGRKMPKDAERAETCRKSETI
jgi:hypothetical protein